MKRFYFDLPKIINTGEMKAFKEFIKILDPQTYEGEKPNFVILPLGSSDELGGQGYVIYEREMTLTKEEQFAIEAARASFSFYRSDSSLKDYSVTELGDVVVVQQDNVSLVCRDYNIEGDREQLEDMFIMVFDEETNRFFNYFVWTHHELPKFGFCIEAAQTRDLDWCVRTVQANMDTLLSDYAPYVAMRANWRELDEKRGKISVEQIVQDTRLENIDHLIHAGRPR